MTAPTLSASRIKDLLRCGYRYFLTRIQKASPEIPPAVRTGGQLHRAIDRLTKGRLAAVSLWDLGDGFDPDVSAEDLVEQLDGPDAELRRRAKVIARNLNLRGACFAEEPFTWGAQAADVRGVFDRVDELDGVVRVCDYKTGSRPVHRNELLDDPQVLIYLAAAHDRWPEYRTEVRWSYVEQGVIQTFPWTPEMHARAEALVAQAAHKLAAEDWAPDVRSDCGSCWVRRHCHAWMAYAQAPAPDPEDLLPSATHQLVELRADLQAKEKAVKDLRRRVDGRLGEIVEKGHPLTIEVEGRRYQIRWKRKDVGRYDEDLLVGRLAAELGREVSEVRHSISTLSKAKLKAFLAELDEAQRDRLDMALADAYEPMFTHHLEGRWLAGKRKEAADA